jgi:thiosulfate/3-mercaptopyruvate sulfurtransferase
MMLDAVRRLGYGDKLLAGTSFRRPDHVPGRQPRRDQPVVARTVGRLIHLIEQHLHAVFQFILQYYGLNAVILNGGWPALASATELPSATALSASGFRAVPGSGSVGLVNRETLRDQLDGRAHVFDTRTRAEYTGEDARNRARSGHLPGARHLSHVDLIENGVVRPAPALRAMLERVGFGPGDHIVTHCEGGGRAALGAAAAVRAGFDDVRLYYLSFGDWVRDESCPVVRE